MARKLVLALLTLAALFVFTGCIGGGGSSPVQQALAWVTGIVSKFRGEPIQGATVTLKETGQSTTTDRQGEFRMGTSYRGTGTLRAEAPGYLPLEWPVEITDRGASVHLRLVSLSDYSASLFATLTGATDTSGTMRWQNGTVRYYVDRSGPWRPEFDAWLQEAFTLWSMAARRAVSFVEGDSSAPLRIRAVPGSPCGYASAAGCGGPTALGPNGEITAAVIELAAPYADQKVVVHEVGHVLSLYGHSPNPEDVMYPGGTLRPTTPSNAEAAVAAVLYANPPGTTLPNVAMPQDPIPAIRVAADPIPQTPGPQVSPDRVPDARPGWWEELMCRFALFAPLCGDQSVLRAIGGP